jgi:hypothetical protein
MEVIDCYIFMLAATMFARPIRAVIKAKMSAAGDLGYWTPFPAKRLQDDPFACRCISGWQSVKGIK